MRIPETLLCAMEFINLYTPNEHQAALEEVRREVAPLYGDLMAKGKKAFWERKASVVKVRGSRACACVCGRAVLFGLFAGRGARVLASSRLPPYTSSHAHTQHATHNT